MPKFVSGSSGHIYGPDKLPADSGKAEDVSHLEAASAKREKEPHQQHSSGSGQTKSTYSQPKPSAINKKGTREQQKSSLDLFKEELRKLTQEREEQRNKLKSSLHDSSCSSPSGSLSTTLTSSSGQSQKTQPQLVSVPLKPDPRCPTALTLQVNLNPKDRSSETATSIGAGSYDNGDPTTTNVYLGNLNPTVNENDLCDIFGKFGPLASIKVMWPRTDEERARNRNSGFVAYMSRIDAERAVKALNGRDLRGYDLKLGWGKTVPLPTNPVYVPPELRELLQQKFKAQTGFPFNAQLHKEDIRRGYSVPNPIPRPLPSELLKQVAANKQLAATKEVYEEFANVLRRSTVFVAKPQDRLVVERIHKTVEHVIKEGPVFEAILIARESQNAAYSFLCDNKSQEHVYYRWKLYSILHGDSPYEWRTSEFRMFEDGPIWKPPPLNQFAEGMPLELVEKLTGIKRISFLSCNSNERQSELTALNQQVSGTSSKNKLPLFCEGSFNLDINDTRVKGSLGPVKLETLGVLLRNLDPLRSKIGSAMMFCINHADAAQEIIDCICESLSLIETPFQKKIARLFLVSDILHNCSAAVTNASFYRKGFQLKLVSIFEHLREYLINIEDRHKAERFKQKVLSVLGAWREWTLYEDELIIELSNILLGIKKEPARSKESNSHELTELESVAEKTTVESQQEHSSQLAGESKPKARTEDDLDGDQLDEELLVRCLESKGLSLRWYQTLNLSGDEDDDDEGEADETESGAVDSSGQRNATRSRRERASASKPERDKFKTSKWETVDPNKVANQVVSLSKWMAVKTGALNYEESPEGSTTSLEDSDGDVEESRSGETPPSKRTKLRSSDSNSD